MRTKVMLFVLVALSIAAPSLANAAKSCVDVYQECLNNTWNTSGLTRYLADLECAARYAGCLKAIIV